MAKRITKPTKGAKRGRPSTAESKSEQMRVLFANGAIVAEVARELGVPYGFAYGVAKRAVEAGSLKSIPAAEREQRAKAPAKRARATKPATVKKATGRPSTKRRQANRKAR